MDILDIDSILKDDSFCFVEEKMISDDVTNIIQQWKINNKQDAIFDGRTFTRGKRRLATNFETPLKNPMAGSTSSNIKMQIGGLVSQNPKSFLGDTSPPNSVSYSMEFAQDQMLNSLITSADFSNVSFLNPTSLDENNLLEKSTHRHKSDFKNYHDELLRTKLPKENPNINNPHMNLNLTEIIENPITQKFDKIGFDKNSFTNDTNEINQNVTFIAQPTEDLSSYNSTKTLTDKKFETDHDAYIRLETDSENYFENLNSGKTTDDFDDNVIQDINLTFAKSSQSIADNIGTPENHNDKITTAFDHLGHSTPILKSFNPEINFSPITMDTTFKKENLILQETFSKDSSPLIIRKNLDEYEDFDNICEINTELNSFEQNEEKFNGMLDNIYHNTEENLKMRNALDTIKKRFTKTAKTNVLCDFTSNGGTGIGGGSPQSAVRLLNKRGRMNEPKPITTRLNKNDEDILNDSLQNNAVDQQSKLLSNNEQIYSNDQKFQTIRIQKQDRQLVENHDLKLELTNKNTNSPIRMLNNLKARPNQLAPGYFTKTNDTIYTENMSKAASANDLDNSIVTNEESATFIKPELKSPMCTKSKSFHNLSRNNFGFARKAQPLSIVPPNEKYIKSNPSQNLPIATSKRSGLIRPSTGIYSGIGIGSKPTQHISNEQLKPSNYDGIVTKYHTDGTEKSQSANEIESRSKLKMNRDMRELKLRPSGLKAPINIKRTGISRPSSLYKT